MQNIPVCGRCAVIGIIAAITAITTASVRRTAAGSRIANGLTRGTWITALIAAKVSFATDVNLRCGVNIHRCGSYLKLVGGSLRGAGMAQNTAVLERQRTGNVDCSRHRDTATVKSQIAGRRYTAGKRQVAAGKYYILIKANVSGNVYLGTIGNADLAVVSSIHNCYVAGNYSSVVDNDITLVFCIVFKVNSPCSAIVTIVAIVTLTARCRNICYRQCVCTVVNGNSTSATAKCVPFTTLGAYRTRTGK